MRVWYLRDDRASENQELCARMLYHGANQNHKIIACVIFVANLAISTRLPLGVVML